MQAAISYEEGSILKETYDFLRDKLGESLDEMVVDRVVMGLFFSGVKLSNGIGGACFTPTKLIPEAVCCPSSAHAMPYSGRLIGKKVLKIMDDLFSSNPLKKTIAIAVLNALSETYRKINSFPGYQFIVDADPMDYVTIEEGSYTIVVGALLPYLRMLRKNNFAYGILELDPKTLKEEEIPHFIPQDRAAQELAKADYLIITGTTLITDSLEGILARRKDTAQVVVVGPTASLVPDAFFSRGIVSLGGITVTKPDGLLDILAEAGSGYHFNGKYAEKTVIIKETVAEELA